MPNIIQLLPDSIANQIAAGEVIQRPSSVVKELLENSIDAEATTIQLIIEDYGKKLIQVVDNGKGMSELDARMSLERHATSKIKSAEDLHRIYTFGFRGEALASIVSIADVELKTRQEQEKLGLHIHVRGSQIESQEFCQAPHGTSILVKNLFFNVPARRKFLKSDSVELKHILDEFYRVAMAHPEIAFSCHHNNKELFNLKSSNLRQRLNNLMGKNYNNKLVPVEEETPEIQVKGYVGKPELAKRRRGGDYLFLNSRFIRNNYLNHAIKAAYANLIPDTHHPFFVLNLTLDPNHFDINVHPTKQEVRFDNEKIIYDLLRAAVRHAIAKHSIAPSIDFDADHNDLTHPATTRLQQSKRDVPSRDYVGGGPKENQPSFGSSVPSRTPNKSEAKAWQDFYEDILLESQKMPSSANPTVPGNISESTKDRALFQKEMENQDFFVFSNNYFCGRHRDQLLLVNYSRAQSRIIYERLLGSVTEGKPISSQTLLFPTSIELPPLHHKQILTDTDLYERMGFEISDLGDSTLVIHAVPTMLKNTHELKQLFEKLYEKDHTSNSIQEIENRILKRIAHNSSQTNRLANISTSELPTFVDTLFKCEEPDIDPNGNKTFVLLSLGSIEKMFN